MEISPTPKLSMKSDDAFSIGTGLEHARITGQSVDFGCLAPLRKQETKKIGRDSQLPLRCLSQLFPMEENINCLGNVCFFFLRTFYRCGDLVFIAGDFLNWMVIQTLLLDERFYFLIAVRLIREN